MTAITTAFVLTFLIFLKGSEPVAVTQAYPDRYSCEKTMGTLVDKAQADAKVLGWTFVGKPCEPIKVVNKI
jgi:hypothetical protein